jgi:hypothetical protein
VLALLASFLVVLFLAAGLGLAAYLFSWRLWVRPPGPQVVRPPIIQINPPAHGPAKPVEKAPAAPLKFAVDDPEDGRIYLTSMKPVATSKLSLNHTLGAAGMSGGPFSHKIQVNGGWHAEKGLSIGPPATPNEPMFVEYNVAGKDQPCYLQMIVGLDDATTMEKPGIVFEVLGDDKLLWTSHTIKKSRDYEDCRIKLDDVRRLTLRYRTLDTFPAQPWTQPVWIDPYLIPLGKAGPKAAPPTTDSP